MPKFLEDKLRAEYGNNPHAIYGTMNKIGAMRGNKETAKGREMERKHEEKMKNAPHKIREIRIEVHRDKKQGVTGHTVHTHHMPKATGKSGAFLEDTHESVPFDANGESKSHGHMLDHIGSQLGMQGAAEAEPDGDEGEEEGEEE